MLDIWLSEMDICMLPQTFESDNSIKCIKKLCYKTSEYCENNYFIGSKMYYTCPRNDTIGFHWILVENLLTAQISDIHFVRVLHIRPMFTLFHTLTQTDCF